MKQRVISALVALAICVPLVIIGGNIFKYGVLVIGLLALREMLKATGYNKLPIFIKYFCYLFTALLILINKSGFYLSLYIMMLVFTSTLILLNKDKKYNIVDCFTIIGIIILLGIGFNGLIVIRSNLMIFIYLFLVSIFTDTYAYLGGRFIGKHKLIPNISPNKTWEGSITGSIFGTLVAALFYYLKVDSNISIYLLLAMTLGLTIIGQIGDLFFSAIKRHYGIKDFSNIMPGHGGILDRLDSILFIIISYILINNMF
ncbi:MAG TPA: phosphatidate cytidylyltransferase [Bacilli bacterium]|nr:phosphatidate cytidylyltransferase [Bacilli bacterium]